MDAAAKARLRADLLAARAALRPEEIVSLRARVRSHVLSRFGSVRRIAAYRPLRTEPGSIELLDALASRGAEVLIPIVCADRDLDWQRWGSDGLAVLGPDAIAAVDVVLVPALAIDRRGNRLGRGAGCYDRALRRVPAGVPLVALIYDGEFIESLPTESWDIPVSAVITPSGWHPVRDETG